MSLPRTLPLPSPHQPWLSSRRPPRPLRRPGSMPALSQRPPVKPTLTRPRDPRTRPQTTKPRAPLGGVVNTGLLARAPPSPPAPAVWTMQNSPAATPPRVFSPPLLTTTRFSRALYGELGSRRRVAHLHQCFWGFGEPAILLCHGPTGWQPGRARMPPKIDTKQMSVDLRCVDGSRGL